MNKIIIKEDIIDVLDTNNDIEVLFNSKTEFFDVNSITVNVKTSTNLKIIYESINEIKLDVKINVFENAKLNLVEYRKANTSKIRYQINIYKNAHLYVSKFYDSKSIKEYLICNLLGENANIDYNFKTISKAYEKYDLTIYHHDKNTISNIKNNGVNIKDGNLIFNVSSFVYNGNKNAEVDQKSRIINLTEEKCQINPNLFIDEYDCIANHSAHIGKFSDEEMFYLNSRGINDNDAIKLLITGFLTSNVDEYVKTKINDAILKYWG